MKDITEEVQALIEENGLEYVLSTIGAYMEEKRDWHKEKGSLHLSLAYGNSASTVFRAAHIINQR